MQIDGQIGCLPVTDNLYLTLKSLRPARGDPLILRVDAICINQAGRSRKICPGYIHERDLQSCPQRHYLAG